MLHIQILILMIFQNSQVLLNQRVVINGRNGQIFGIVGSKSIHLMSEKDRKEPIKRENMYIDVGANNKESVEDLGIRIGDPITWIGKLERLHSDRICGKALDGRIGLLILSEIFKILFDRIFRKSPREKSVRRNLRN